MDLQTLSKALDGINAGLLMPLLDSADVSPTGGQEQILLGRASGRAQLLERTAKVGLTGRSRSRHGLDFRAMGPERPRPNGLIELMSNLMDRHPREF